MKLKNGFSSNENGLRCYLFHALALSLLSKYKNLVERKTRFSLSKIRARPCDLPPKRATCLKCKISPQL